MKSRLLCVMAAATVAALSVGLAGRAARPSLLVSDVTLVDGTGALPRSGVSLLIRDGRLVSVAPAGEARPADAARVIDGRGLFAIPGLIDAHVHLTGGSRADELASLRTALRGGVTAVWDLAGDARNLGELSREALVGDIESPAIYYVALMSGPEFFTDPRVVEASAGYRPGDAPWARALTPDLDLVQTVAEARGTGAIALKLYAALDAPTVRRVIAEAHRQRLRVVAHGTVFPAKPGDLVDAGADMLAHAAYLAWEGSPPSTEFPKRAQGDFAGVPPDSPVIDRLLGAMRDRHVALNPTLWVFADHPAADGLADRRIRWGAEVTRRAYRAGVTIVAGTDGMTTTGDPLPTLHRELELLVTSAGLPPLAALSAATHNAAEVMGLGAERGTLLPGGIADLVLLGANPVDDIRNTRAIRYVIKGGAVVREPEVQRSPSWSGDTATPSPSPALPGQLPVVDVLYPPGGSLLDRWCKTDLKIPVDERALQAAVQQRPDLQKQWDAEGPSYLRPAFAEIGLGFPYREVQATLTVCLPASMSIPLIVDVRPFLPNATKPAPAWEFPEILFHEMMHVYVSPALQGSALMKKYRDEPATTKYHLHVMAIETMVLLKLNRPDRLAIIDREYRGGPDPAYKRAWEIVNDIEGYKVFIDELKAVRKGGR
ncbi:MAG TPA: amidohydrolase family protein [Vicinamibacterales bacterium]|jgi:imidazolonepropionase-like amidohydrolase